MAPFFFSFSFTHVDQSESRSLSLDILILPVLSFLQISFFPHRGYLRHCWPIGTEGHVINLALGDMSIYTVLYLRPNQKLEFDPS